MLWLFNIWFDPDTKHWKKKTVIETWILSMSQYYTSLWILRSVDCFQSHPVLNFFFFFIDHKALYGTRQQQKKTTEPEAPRTWM